MQIFLDTANIENIRQAAELGIISGVTTNPTLLSKESTADYETVTKKICSIVNGPVSVEVLAEDANSIIEEARMKAAWESGRHSDKYDPLLFRQPGLTRRHGRSDLRQHLRRTAG
jgi:hypothetical protein